MVPLPLEDTSGVSVGATSTLVVCQRPSKCHQCDSVPFPGRRQGGLTTLTKRPFVELLLRCLELVGNLWPPINPTKCSYIDIGRALPLQLSLPLHVRAIPYRLQTLLKTLAFSCKILSHTPSTAERIESEPWPLYLFRQCSQAWEVILFNLSRRILEQTSAFIPLYGALLRPHPNMVCQPVRQTSLQISTNSKISYKNGNWPLSLLLRRETAARTAKGRPDYRFEDIHGSLGCLSELIFPPPQGTPSYEPPKGKVGIFGEGYEILE